MSKGINLLGAKKQVVLSPATKRLKMLRTLALWLLFGISAASVVLFLLIALSPLPSLQEQEQKALVTLSDQHPDVAKLMLIADRLDSSSGIIKKRANYAQALSFVKEKMPTGVTVSALSFKDRDVSITVTSSSLVLLDTFMNNLVAAIEAKEEFSQVALTTLTAEGTTYKVTVDMPIL